MPLALRGNDSGKTQEFLFLLVKVQSLDASVSTKKLSLSFSLFFFSTSSCQEVPVAVPSGSEKRWLGPRKVDSTLW